VTVAGLWREGMEDASEHRGGPETPGHQEAVRCLLVAWVLATVVLISSGVAFERRCIEGFHIALALLAAPLVVGVARRACARRPRQIALCVGGFIALSCPTALWYAAREYPSQMGYINPDLMPAEAAIYRWMGDGAVVLARPDASLWLPTRGRVRVYAGHPQLTFNAHAKSHTVRRFFSPETTPAERAVMFGNTGSNLVAATGSDTALLARDRTHWVQVLSVGSVAVFERTHSPGVGPFLARRQDGVEAFACAGAPLR